MVKSAFVVSTILFPVAATRDFQGGSSDAHESNTRDGAYVGCESMPNLSPEDPEPAWFHENTLLVRNGEAILDKVPIVIRGARPGPCLRDVQAPAVVQRTLRHSNAKITLEHSSHIIGDAQRAAVESRSARLVKQLELLESENRNVVQSSGLVGTAGVQPAT